MTAARRAAPRSGVLLVAPFARGAAHGGSLRATAMAERLEARGLEVDWRRVRAEPGTRAAKLRSLLRGEPAVVRTHRTAPVALDTPYDAVVASHSYLAPVLDGLPGRVARLVDFHNLEWRVLADTGHSEGGAHGAYLRLQGVLMRRFERAVLTSGAHVALASSEEHAWACRAAPGIEAVVAPNVLTAAAVEEAERIAALREGRAPGKRFVYVGTLTFPPNVHALLAFLEGAWSAVRAAAPGAELLVAGRCAPGVSEAVGRHPGVRALGFADDLGALLAGATAALLPFEGRGGSSLRCLQYALARVPVIASPAAARGLPFAPGLVAHDRAGWAAAAAACLAGETVVAETVERAHAGASAVQAHEAPWDALAAALAPGVAA